MIVNKENAGVFILRVKTTIGKIGTDKKSRIVTQEAQVLAHIWKRVNIWPGLCSMSLRSSRLWRHRAVCLIRDTATLISSAHQSEMTTRAIDTVSNGSTIFALAI